MLDGLFEAVPEGLVVHHPESGAIVDANDRFCEMHGYDRAEVCEMSVMEFTDDEWDPPVAPEALVADAHETGSTEFEWRNVDADGEAFWVEVALAPVTYRGRDRVLARVRDVTQRKERERQLQVLDRVLRHNLYNDMNVVRSRAELITDRGEEAVAEMAESIVEKVDDFVETADKEREIVKRLLEGGERVHVDIAAQVRSRVETARSLYPEASVRLDAPVTATAVAAGGFGRAVAELLENAVVHSDREEPTVAVTVRRRPEEVVVTVADDGPGVPEQEVGVLTSGQEVAPLYHGSGLGLWLVNWTVELSGGSVCFEANEPRGSVVTVRQPRP